MKTIGYALVLLVLMSACTTEKIVTKYQCYDNSVSDTLEGCPVQPNTLQLLKECTTRLTNATEVLSTCDFRINELVRVISELREPAKNVTVTGLLAQLKGNKP